MTSEFPNEMVIDGLKFKKSTNEIYLEFKPELSKSDVDEFLDDAKDVIDWQFEPTDPKKVQLTKYNKFSTHSKWVISKRKTKRAISNSVNTLLQDERIRAIRSVYFREDLKRPNGFTYTDQIIIKFRKGAERDLQNHFRKMGVEEVKGPQGDLGKGIMLLRALDIKKQNAYEVAQKLNELEIILSAKVNLIQLHSGFAVIPNDTYFTNQWNLRNTGQTLPDGDVGTIGCDINVEPAWNISKGSPLVVIAILDSGCDLDHQDLMPNYVQRDRMYDALTGGNNADDYYRHGTCVAGIASSQTNSLTAQGVSGVGWHCRIMPVAIRFSEAAITNSLRWALDHHANIISMSWHYDGPHADIDDALEDCYNAGIVMFAASGNDAPDEPDLIYYPASNNHVIAVGATNENDARCSSTDWPGQGSQYGPELSVVAPGVHTWSTDMRGLGIGHGYNDTYGGGDAVGDYYENFGGTSGATPHVAGLAGLMLAYNPMLTPSQIRSIIENTADDLVGDPAEDTAGWDKYMGHGRINAHAAMLEVQTNHPFNPAEVYIRDSLNDTGVEPYIGSPLCYSPDIIIRKLPVANPQADFSDMTVDPGSDLVDIGNDNYIYIRVHNIGTITTDIHVRVYFAPLTTTCTPDQWEYLGQIDFYEIANGTSAVSDALVWENVPDPGSVGHYCIIASIEGVRDPHPDPSGITNATTYMDFIRNHNNICYRNVMFEDVLPNTTTAINFVLPGFVGGLEKYDLRIDKKDLAVRADIDLRLNNELFRKTRVHLDMVVERTDRFVQGNRLFRLERERRSELRRLLVPPGKNNIARLELHIPEEAKPGETYEVLVQQIFEGEVIGDFTVKGQVIDPRKAKFIAVRDKNLVHKADCDGLLKTNKELWVPFKTLEDAKTAGYDLALDCLRRPFFAKEVSYKLAKKVLHYVNYAEMPNDLFKVVNEKAEKKGVFDIQTARAIFQTRERVGRFKKIQEIESIKAVKKEHFTELVNAFK